MKTLKERKALVEAARTRMDERIRKESDERLKAAEAHLSAILKARPELSEYDPEATLTGKVLIRLPQCVSIEVSCVNKRVTYLVAGEGSWSTDLDAAVVRANSAWNSAWENTDEAPRR